MGAQAKVGLSACAGAQWWEIPGGWGGGGGGVGGQIHEAVGSTTLSFGFRVWFFCSSGSGASLISNLHAYLMRTPRLRSLALSALILDARPQASAPDALRLSQ